MEEGIESEMADNDEKIGHLMSQFLSFSEDGKVDTSPATREKAAEAFDSNQEAQDPYLKEAARFESQKFWNKAESSFLAVAFLSAEKMERSLPAKDKEKKLGKLPRALGSVLTAMHPDAAQQADPSAAQPSAPALALPAEIEATQATLAQLRMGDLEAGLCLGLSQASSTTPAPLESPALPPAPTPVLL